MKKLATYKFTSILLLLSVLMLSLVASSCNSQTGNVIVNIDWVDFLKFNDITYLREIQNNPVNQDNLTFYTEVKFKIADNVNNPNYSSKNGDAAFLEAGTKIYTLAGYSPNFRLVAIKDQELLIYEADTNPNAKKGGDLLDIGDKVDCIDINSSIDGKTELASVKDKMQVDQLVQMVLDAPVDQTLHKTGTEQYFLEFHLIDGTVTKRSYWLDSGILSRGIQLPEEFKDIIRITVVPLGSGVR